MARRGFTLVETVGSVFVLLLLIAVAVPTFQSVFGNSQNSAAEQELARIARVAQSSAISARRDSVAAGDLAAAVASLREGRRDSDNNTALTWQLVDATTPSTSRGEVSWAAGENGTVALAMRYGEGCAFAILQEVGSYETWSSTTSCTGTSALSGKP